MLTKLLRLCWLSLALPVACSTSSTLKAPDFGASSIVVTPAFMLADGMGAATVTVTLRLVNGAPVPDVMVTLSADQCDISQPNAPTGSDGQATGSITSHTAGKHTITVMVQSDEYQLTLPQTATVNFASPTTTTALKVTGVPTDVAAGAPFSAVVTAVDGAGNGLSTYIGTVQLRSSDVHAVLPADVVFVSDDAGSVVVPNLVLTTAGTQTLIATDVASATVASPPATVNVQAGAVTSLHVLSPSSATAGQAVLVTVAAQDMYGNVVLGYTGTVAVSSSDPQAVLPAALVFGSRNGGSETALVTFKTLGAYTITATDTSVARLYGSSTPIAVSAAAASQLLVTGITQGVAGTVSTVSVAALDPYGNVVTSQTGTLHFTSSDSNATLPADTPLVNSDNGHLTLTNAVILRTSGRQSVTVADVVNGLVGSQTNIVVTPKAPASVQLQIDASANAGQALSAMVNAVDTYGNVATSFTGTVQFSCSDANAVLPLPYTFASADSGSHTFSVTLATSGSQSLTVDAQNPPLGTSQSSIFVSPGNASQVQISGVSSPLTAGQSSSMTVTLLDAFNNVATGYQGTLALTSSDQNAVLSQVTLTSSDQGTETVSNAFILTTAGAQTVTAADTVLSRNVSGSISTTVMPAAVARLLLTGLASSIAGTPQSIHVLATDSYGNATPSATGSVKFTSTDPNATLPGTTNLSNGAATDANGVTLVTAGAQTVTASLTSSPTINGNQSVTVRPGSVSATKSTFTAAPAAVLANNANQAVLTVVAKDAWNNVISQQAVSLSANSNVYRFSATSGATSSSGSFSATLTSSAPGNAIVSANLGPFVLDTNVRFLAPSAFAAPVNYATTTYVYGVALAHLSGNSNNDIVVVNYEYGSGANSFQVLLNRGNGTFGTATTYSTNYFVRALAVGDLTNDGYPDVALASENAPVLIALNQGNGTFGSIRQIGSSGHPYGIAMGNLTGNGNNDVIIPNYDQSLVTRYTNVGNANFASSSVGVCSAGVPVAVVAGDVNGDGRVDVMSANGSADIVSVFLNLGNGNFAAESAYALGASISYIEGALALGDFNGDGRPDLAAANLNGAVVILLNKGSGTFGAPTLFSTGSGTNPTSLATADFNLDGYLDLAVTSLATHNWFVLLGDGVGQLTSPTAYGSGGLAYGIAAGDVNGDGKPDVVATNSTNGSVSVYINTCP